MKRKLRILLALAISIIGVCLILSVTAPPLPTFASPGAIPEADWDQWVIAQCTTSPLRTDERWLLTKVTDEGEWYTASQTYEHIRLIWSISATFAVSPGTSIHQRGIVDRDYKPLSAGWVEPLWFGDSPVYGERAAYMAEHYITDCILFDPWPTCGVGQYFTVTLCAISYDGDFYPSKLLFPMIMNEYE